MLLQREGERVRKRTEVKMKKMMRKRAKNIVMMRWMKRSCWNWRSIVAW